MRPPVTEHVSLHSKLLCENIARASGGANNMRPLSWGGTNGKDPTFELPIPKKSSRCSATLTLFYPLWTNTPSLTLTLFYPLGSSTLTSFHPLWTNCPHSYTTLLPLPTQLLSQFTPSEQVTNQSYTALPPLAAHLLHLFTPSEQKPLSTHYFTHLAAQLLPHFTPSQRLSNVFMRNVYRISHCSSCNGIGERARTTAKNFSGSERTSAVSFELGSTSGFFETAAIIFQV